MGQSSTVKGKLTLLIASATLGILLLIGIGFFEITTVYNTTNYANTSAIPSITKIDQITTHFGFLRVRFHRHLLSFTDAEMKETEDKIKESIENVNKNLNEYQTLIDDPVDRKYYDQEVALFKQYVSLMEPVLVLSRKNKTEEASALNMKTTTIPAVELQKILTEHIAHNTKLAIEHAKEADNTKHKAFVTLGIISFITLITILIMGRMIIKGLYHQLGGEPTYAVDITKEIAHGNLTSGIKIKSGDSSSVLVALNKMQDVLKNTVKNIAQSASAVNQSILQLNNNTKQIQSASAQQSESSNAVASTVEELTVSIESIHHNATETLNLAKQAKQFSAESKSVINNVASEVQSVANVVSISVELTKNLDQRSQEINSIVGIIGEVAEQTNLLALNAAIEAARAGESGKGFAVVADEVRKLAERTTQSTEQIRNVIGAIRNDIDKVVDNMNKSEQSVTSSVNLAKQASTSIDQIVDSSNQISDLISDISNSLEEQSKASQEIAHNIENIADMSQRNNQSVSETANIANHLEQQANTLNKLLQYFKA